VVLVAICQSALNREYLPSVLVSDGNNLFKSNHPVIEQPSFMGINDLQQILKLKLCP